MNTKEQILDAAGRLIPYRGFTKTSVDDILKECGVGKGNFYYYFKSKDALGFATLDRMLEQFRLEFLDKPFDRTRNPWSRLEAFFNSMTARAQKTGCTGGCPLGNLALELSDIHEEFRHRLGEAFAVLRSRIEAALAEARSEGSLAPGTDVPRLSHYIVAGLEGAFMLGKLHRNPALMAEIVEELKTHVFRYRVTTAPHAATSDRPGDGHSTLTVSHLAG